MRLRYPVVLASASPRRVELIRELIEDFTIDPANVDESLTAWNPWETAAQLAENKADTVFARHPDSLVIGGDTIVAVGDETEEWGWRSLGKPTSELDALEMLRLLSGCSHLVITGVAFRWPEGRDTIYETTIVRFRELSQVEIEEYVATGEPMDKAGAYAIQGGAAGFALELDGSQSNVVGLPMERVQSAMMANGLFL